MNRVLTAGAGPSTARIAAALAMASCGWAVEPLAAGAFELHYQSSKAMAMGGAFVAQAEDPSAVFYNVGALALLEKKPQLVAGVAAINLSQSVFQGLPPGTAAGTNGEQDSTQSFVPHAYWAQPLGAGKLGFGVYSPFMAETDWADPDTFSGRFIDLTFRLRTLDLTSAVAFEIAPGLALGAGVVYRLSDLRHRSRVPSFDPGSGQVVDVAGIRVEATQDTGVGWTAGLLQQIGDGLALGLSYHSGIEIDYDGEARLTQIPTGNAALDALIAQTIPLDQDLSFRSQIEFPQSAALGVALSLSDGVVVEVDANWTGWSSFQSLDLLLPNNSELDRSMPQNYADSMAYRVGTRIDAGGGSFLRFGAAFDESPQPDAALGPLFPDSDRTSYAVGYSKDWLDVSLIWSEGETRTTTANLDDFNGTYTASSWILGITISE